jgi:hypothetical protein
LFVVFCVDLFGSTKQSNGSFSVDPARILQGQRSRCGLALFPGWDCGLDGGVPCLTASIQTTVEFNAAPIDVLLEELKKADGELKK